jgi:hypothetical protein
MWHLKLRRRGTGLHGRASAAAVAALAAALALLAPSASLARTDGVVTRVAQDAGGSKPATSQALSRLSESLTPAQARTKPARFDTSYNAVYRWSFQTYVDCDYVGFYGVYYGWWPGYVCYFNTSTRWWDLYA